MFTSAAYLYDSAIHYALAKEHVERSSRELLCSHGVLLSASETRVIKHGCPQPSDNIFKRIGKYPDRTNATK